MNDYYGRDKASPLGPIVLIVSIIFGAGMFILYSLAGKG
jgi:hypothetical protein